jgi:DNA-binding transcriptional MerR regulator
VQEVADFLGVPPRSLYDWRLRGYGPPSKKIGRYLRYDPAALRRWLDSLDEAA